MQHCYLLSHSHLPHLHGMDEVVSIKAGFQLVHRRSVHVFQPAEEAAIQVAPVVPQRSQVVALHELLQLLHDLIHLRAQEAAAVTRGLARKTALFLDEREEPCLTDKTATQQEEDAPPLLSAVTPNAIYQRDGHEDP